MKNYIIFGIVAVLVIVGAVMYRSSSNQQPTVDSGEVKPTVSTEPASDLVRDPLLENNKVITMENGLKIEDVKIGTGDVAVKGALISVHYVGTLVNGKKFDSSRDRGEPFQFPLGQGMVIQGWEQGFEGMKVGGIRKLTIPPALGYGSQDVGPIPANSTLLFEVELLAVRLK
jgi:FKBP-type peptidyl-prolyl cis-trans isomerase